MSASPNDPNWQAGVDAVHAEAAGAVEISVIMQSGLDDLLLEALAGGRQAQTLMPAVLQALSGIAAAPKKNPMLCAPCPRALRPGGHFNLAIAVPARDGATRAIGMAVCSRCATEPAQVLAKAIDGFKRIWPDLRTAVITHPDGGRA